MSSCSSCGRENPAGAGFCNGCGKPLEAAPAPREQRKTVTILFCDVTGSTAMGERLDPESLRQVMRRYFDAARTVIEQHGGTVEKFIGDAVMAVFGVPVLHEDDALRAVRAAAGLRDALVSLNDALQRDYGTTVTVRTGAAKAAASAPSISRPSRHGWVSFPPPKRAPEPAASTTASSSFDPPPVATGPSFLC